MARMRLYEIEIPANLQVDVLGEKAANQSGGKLQVQAHGEDEGEIKASLKELANNVNEVAK